MISNAEFIAELRGQIDDQEVLKNGICEICGETDPHALHIMEQHHISTVACSDSTCVCCLNCHAAVTHEQNLLPPELRSRKLPLWARVPYIFLTHAALRKRMAEIEIRLIKELWPKWKEFIKFQKLR